MRSPCGQGHSSNRYLKISRTRPIANLSAGISFLLLDNPKEGTFHPQSTKPIHPSKGRHHFGIRGRLILGRRGRNHLGIGGRHTSEFAARRRLAHDVLDPARREDGRAGYRKVTAENKAEQEHWLLDLYRRPWPTSSSWPDTCSIVGWAIRPGCSARPSIFIMLFCPP